MKEQQFEIIEEYHLESGDLVLLPYFHEDKPIFVQDIMASFPCAPRCHQEQGGDITLFKGDVDGKECLVRALRLDKKYLNPIDVLKEKLSKGLELVESEGLKRLVLSIDVGIENGSDLIIAALEGTILGGYKFDKYLSEKKPMPKVVCHTGQRPPLRPAAEPG